MRQTGGTALGEISTRSRPRSRAILRASKGARMPSCSPFSSITRISRARIRSLMRIKDLAARLSNAMVLLQCCSRGGFIPQQRETHPEYSTGLVTNVHESARKDDPERCAVWRGLQQELDR